MTSQTDQEWAVRHAVLFGGITSALLGLILLLKTEEGIGLLMVLLGLWWLVYGAFNLLAVFIDKTGWGWQITVGTLGLAAGYLTLTNPLGAAAALGTGLAVVVGALALVIGVSAVFGFFQGGGFGALLFGVVSGAVGIIFVFNPLDSASTTVTVLAWVMLVSGVAAVFQSFMNR